MVIGNDSGDGQHGDRQQSTIDDMDEDDDREGFRVMGRSRTRVVVPSTEDEQPADADTCKSCKHRGGLGRQHQSSRSGSRQRQHRRSSSTEGDSPANREPKRSGSRNHRQRQHRRSSSADNPVIFNEIVSKVDRRQRRKHRKLSVA
jgi:hypothetical protein